MTREFREMHVGNFKRSNVETGKSSITPSDPWDLHCSIPSIWQRLLSRHGSNWMATRCAQQQTSVPSQLWYCYKARRESRDLEIKAQIRADHAGLLSRLHRITSSGKYIPEIDGLRFVAILSVVLFHVQGQLALPGPADGPLWL